MSNDKPFIGGIQVELNKLDPVMLEDVDALALKIIKLTMDECGDGIERKPNVCLGAMQKALGLIISQWFHKKDMPSIVEGITISLKKNVDLWKEIKVDE
jgi:hypothetical protein